MKIAILYILIFTLGAGEKKTKYFSKGLTSKYNLIRR
jgi:hypothetical protein